MSTTVVLVDLGHRAEVAQVPVKCGAVREHAGGNSGHHDVAAVAGIARDGKLPSACGASIPPARRVAARKIAKLAMREVAPSGFAIHEPCVPQAHDHNGVTRLIAIPARNR
jgi:hypothetical protein